MEVLNVQNKMIMLPPGFRFHPTDEELVVQYLLCKALSCPLPALIIPEVNVCKYDPWDLPGDNNIGRYFFSTRDVKYSGGNRSNRATGSGYWKATGIDKRIVASKSNQVVGMKKILAFYRGKPPNGSRTDWVMHEYRLVGFETSACIFPQMKNTNQNLTIRREDLVLCCVFLKKGTNYVQRKENKIGNPSLMELMMQDKTVPHPSYFCSSSPTSEITEEVSSTEIADHGESSSNYNSASSLTIKECHDLFCSLEAVDVWLRKTSENNHSSTSISHPCSLYITASEK